MTVLVSRTDLGGAMAWADLGDVCSFWEAYINTGWDGEGKEGCNGLPRKKSSPRPSSSACMEGRKEAHFSLLPSLSPGLQL